jgi:hypothetical protein
MKKSSALLRIQPSTKGQGGTWRVRVIRSDNIYDARFADINYENSEQARSAAQAFLDALMQILPPPRRLQRLGSDGLPGTLVRIDMPRPMWTAVLSVEKRTHRKCFSVGKYGEHEAHRMATEARAEWLRNYGFDQPQGLPSTSEVQELANTIRQRFNERPRSNINKGEFNDDQMYGLSRRESDMNGSGGYWLAGLVRRGITYRKRFSDSVYGSNAQAFAAAAKYRDEILSNVDAMPRRERHEMLSTRNTSGVSGVYMKRERGQLVGWGATIMVQGKLHRRSFSIKKCGAELAFELAVNARTSMLELAEGDCALSPAVKFSRKSPSNILATQSNKLVSESDNYRVNSNLREHASKPDLQLEVVFDMSELVA